MPRLFVEKVLAEIFTLNLSFSPFIRPKLGKLHEATCVVSIRFPSCSLNILHMKAPTLCFLCFVIKATLRECRYFSVKRGRRWMTVMKSVLFVKLRLFNSIFWTRNQANQEQLIQSVINLPRCCAKSFTLEKYTKWLFFIGSRHWVF